MRLKSILASALFGLSSVSAFADIPITVERMEGPLAQSIHETILAKVEETGFSGAIIVEDEGQIVLNAGYGYSDRENAIPFTTETIGQIGSITKQFTAVLALMFVEDGLLDLNVPISTYIPEAPAPGANVTLHQLMTHTAGLSESCGGRDFDVMPVERLISECLSFPLVFEPGSQSNYANAGFSLVAAVIERVSGETLEDLLRDRVFTPNEMTRTAYLYDLEEGLAFGYHNDTPFAPINTRIQQIWPDYWILKGNGGIQSPVVDMHRWSRVLGGDGDLSPAVRQQFLTPQFQLEDNLWVGYGWYFRVDSEGNVLRLGHSGSDGIFFSNFWMDRANGTFYYLVGNAGEELTLDVYREVQNEMMSDPR